MNAHCLKRIGPEAEECQKLIAAHKVCLRKEGFNVSPAEAIQLLGTCSHHRPNLH